MNDSPLASMNLVLESERLVLRPLAEQDLDVSIEILTDPEVVKYIAAVRTRDQVAEHLPVATRRCAGGAVGIWCVIERSSPGLPSQYFSSAASN